MSVLMAAAAQTPPIVREVRAAIDAKNFPAAQQALDRARKATGVTPAWVLAYSWMGRGHLAAKHWDDAERFAAETRNFVLPMLKTRKLDDDKWLPLALGASIEVQAMIHQARGERIEAVAFLRGELIQWKDTSIRTRIQKNIYVVSLVGKRAPVLSVSEFVGAQPPTLGALKGRTVLLFFWAHWCGDCKATADAVARVAKEVPSLAVIGPTQTYGYAAEGAEVKRPEELNYIEQIRQKYYGAIRGMTVPVSEENLKLWGVSTTPTLAVINKQGVVVLYHPGRMTYEELLPYVRN
ncbi:MAG TPA: TlpA disulfide reductase family protein [Paludibaculum sp.]